MNGRVHTLHVKPETPGERGLPKPRVAEARFGSLGVGGDFNRWRADKGKTGDPTYAVLLLPLETIQDLARDGWPVREGDLGENVTTVGIPYDAFAPGTRWRVGSATIEIAKPCDPCVHLYGLPYVGKERGPSFLKATLGRRGWYAKVEREGTVRVGDPVERE